MSALRTMKNAVIPFTFLSLEERQLWIDQCYVLPQSNSALYDSERSVLLIGERGSGLSTIFDVFRHEYALIDDNPAPPLTQRPFCFAYPIHLWPGQPQALFIDDGTSHFKQWMALIAQHLISVFKRDPRLLQRIPLSSFDFVVWLMRHYLGPRRAEMWYRFVEQQHSSAKVGQIVDEARLGKHDHVYTDSNNDITGQIEDLPFSLNFYRENDQAMKFGDLRYEEQQIIAGMQAAYQRIEHNLPDRPLLDGLLDRVQAQAHGHTCGVGQNYVVITHEGTVAQCQMELAHAVTFEASSDLIPLVASGAIHNISVDEKEGCRTCEWRYRCSGGCPLMTLRSTGRVDIKSPNCHIYQTLYPAALRLEGLRILNVHGQLGA